MMRYNIPMKQRARSIAEKTRRADDLIAAAEFVAVQQGGIRYLTLEMVAEHVGIHRTGVRRYYASKEELLLALAERGWSTWRDRIAVVTEGLEGIGPKQVADVICETITAQPVFCDVLTHVPLNLEGDVDIERARQYKKEAFSVYDDIVRMLVQVSTMTPAHIQSLLTATLALTSYLWQVSHPTPTLAELYRQVPSWGHVALDFEPRLQHLLEACALGMETC
jgi:AcrR family transcriptional regulator